MPVKHTLEAIAEAAGARVISGGTMEIGGIASLDSAGGEDLVFVEDAARLEEALRSSAGAILAGEFAAGTTTEKALLIAKNPRLAFARAGQLIRPGARHFTGIHSTAEVHGGAHLGKQVAVDAHAYVGERCVIGDRTHIGPGAYVAPNVRIGSDCEIHANVSIYPNTAIGDRVMVHCGAVLGADGFGFVRDPETGAYEKFPQVGRLEIGDDVEIGANTTIDRGALDATVIGSGTKLDNLVHIGHNARVGRNVVIAAQTGVSGSSVIEDNAIIGGQVGIGDHATVGEGVILGSQGGVLTNKVVRGRGEQFWGTPARPIKGYLKELATLSRLAKGKGKKPAE